MTFASIASFTIHPSPAVSRTPGNDGWHAQAPRTYLPSVAPDLRWPSSPCRQRLTVPASFLDGSSWPRRIWRRDAWSAHSRPCYPWMSAISSLGRKRPLLGKSFAVFATGCSVRCKAPPTPTELRKPLEWHRGFVVEQEATTLYHGTNVLAFVLKRRSAPSRPADVVAQWIDFNAQTSCLWRYGSGSKNSSGFIRSRPADSGRASYSRRRSMLLSGTHVSNVPALGRLRR